MFRRTETGCGKLVVFDEAHKYLDTKMGDLCSDVVELVRMMRHHGIRVVVSTQNPSILDPELFELSSAVILHRFSSPSWCVSLRSGSLYRLQALTILSGLLCRFSFLQSKVHLPAFASPLMTRLETGQVPSALSSRMHAASAKLAAGGVLLVCARAGVDFLLRVHGAHVWLAVCHVVRARTQALVFCPQAYFLTEPHKLAMVAQFLYRVSVRARLTADGGASVTSTSARGAGGKELGPDG
jgi:hypothetical protein